MTVEWVTGVGSVCAVCRLASTSWWRSADFYACVHPACGESLVADCPALSQRRAVRAVDTAPVRRRGAYARRAAGSGLVSHFLPSRFAGSGNWVVWGQTNVGVSVVPCGGNAGHGVHVVRHWEALAASGREVSSGGVHVVGAVLRDPADVVVMSWGHEPKVSAPLWEPLIRSVSWGSCRHCGAYVWPGRWVTMDTGRCILCAEGSARPWPHDADFPGDEFMPDHMRDDVPTGRRRTTSRRNSRADHA